MKYSYATIAKALGAFIVALLGAVAAKQGGYDFSNISLDEWLEGLIPALVAGVGVLHIPTAPGGSPVNTPAVPVPASAAAAAAAVASVASVVEAHSQLAQTAVDSIKAVQSATGELTKLLPAPVEKIVSGEVQAAANALGMGPLAHAVIKGVGL